MEFLKKIKSTTNKLLSGAYCKNLTKQLSSCFDKPSNLGVVNKFYLNCATLGGCGYFKYGSGTLASVIAAIVGLVLVSFSQSLLCLVLVIALVVGFISADKTVTPLQGDPDPSFIVIDEFAGQLIPFILIGMGRGLGKDLILALFALLIFRVLDIYKPWVIGKSEKVFHGGIGIMIDDVLAGIFTLFAIFIIQLFM